MMSPDVMIQGSSKNITGSKDASVDINFFITGPHDTIHAELLFKGISELL